MTKDHIRRTIGAIALSILLHILVPLIEGSSGLSSRSADRFDAVFSWPAKLWTEFYPSGHGFMQLAFPIFFSIALYSAAFWVVLMGIYKAMRKNLFKTHP